MSYAVLFPVVMCSPVRPLPSCPFCPLPNEKTKDFQAYEINVVYPTGLGHTSSRFRQQNRKRDARRCFDNALLAPIM